MSEDEKSAEYVVTTSEECVAYVNRVGICSWQQLERLPEFPSLEAVTPWARKEIHLHTWFWKDDLHIERRLYYGKLLGTESPAFVSLALLPTLIAAQGDNDPHTLFEQGRLSQMALDIYRHIDRSGPTPSNQLPWRPGSRQMHLVALERRFILTKHGLTGRTRGMYGYIWGKCEDHFPEAFTTASRLSVRNARQRVQEHLMAQGVELTLAHTAKLFRWSEE